MKQYAKQQGAVDNEFDAAKAIVETLKGLDKEKQQRAMRFASEALGLQAPAVLAGPSSPALTDQGHAPAKTTDSAAPARSKDIKQFTADKVPRTDQQFAAVVAYYYRFEAPPEEQRKAIGVKDLNEAVRLVGRRRPPSPLATLTNAKNKGYLDKVGRAQFRINAVGENLVAMTLPGKDRATPSGRKGGRTAKKKKTKVPTKRRTKAAK